MRLPDILTENADAFSSVTSILGFLACAYMAKLTDMETNPFKIVQQLSLCALALALLANGLYVFPEWRLINGHRPTGLLVESAAAINMIVMAARGYLKFYAVEHRDGG